MVQIPRPRNTAKRHAQELRFEVRIFPVLHINVINVRRQRMVVVLPVNSAE